MEDVDAPGEPVHGGESDAAGIVGRGIHGDSRRALDDESAGPLDSAGEGRGAEALDVERACDVLTNPDGAFEVDIAVAEDVEQGIASELDGELESISGRALADLQTIERQGISRDAIAAAEDLEVPELIDGKSEAEGELNPSTPG